MSENSGKNTFLGIVSKDFDHFISRFLGEKYHPRNNFSQKQKNKILAYLYLKNAKEIRRPKQKYYKETKFSPEMNKEQAIELLKHLDEIESYNRMFLISSYNECQKRVATTGYIMGALAGGFLWLTAMKNWSYVRKIPIVLTIIHLGGQYAYFRVLDRTFDGLYPFFAKDLEIYFKEKKVRDEILQAKDSKELEKLIEKSLEEDA